MGLANLQPDFEALVQQLRAKLGTFDSWNGVLTTDTGEHLIDYFGSISAYDQLAIESAYQEVNSGTAKFDSSVRALVRTLGSRMSRKLPARTTVTLVREGTAGVLTIPAYSQFSSNRGIPLFNREPIQFANGSAVPTYEPGRTDLDLFAGSVVTRSVAPDGSRYWQYISEEDNFEVSDIDVLIKVNGVDVEAVQDGLWHYPNNTPLGIRRVAWESTINTGELILTFGSELFGYQTQVSDDVELTYVTTLGTGQNDESFLGSEVTLETDLGVNVEGESTSPLSGGADEVPIQTYKRVAPQLYASFQRAVTRSDHNAIAITYPGVIDAVIRGQAELAPGLKEFMNVAKVSLLRADGTTFTVPEFDAFVEWYREKSLYNVDLIQDTTLAPYVIDVEMDVYCEAFVNLNTAKTAIEQALAELFTPRFGLIGSRIFRGDFINVAYDVVKGVRHVKLNTPTIDIATKAEAPVINYEAVDVTIAPYTSYVALPGGATYNYSVTAITPMGESLVSNLLLVPPIGANKAVELQWEPTIGATGYRIYGRTNDSRVLIGIITLSQIPELVTFVDDGQIIPGTNIRQIVDTVETVDPYPSTPEPTINTAALFYPKAGTILVRPLYAR